LPSIDNGATGSPHETHIAFQSNRGANTEVYVMNADGSGQTRLTDSPDGAAWPKWTREWVEDGKNDEGRRTDDECKRFVVRRPSFVCLTCPTRRDV